MSVTARLRRSLPGGTLGLAVAVAAAGLAAPATHPTADAAEPSCALVPGGEGGAIDREWYPEARDLTAVMLYLDFPDAPASADESFDDYASRLLPDVDWMVAASQGALRFEVREHRTWLRMPDTASSYGMARSDAVARIDDYVDDAIGLADPAVDFTGVDLLYLVPQRGAPADFSPAHTSRWSTADGSEVRGVVTFGSDMFEWDRNLLTHETGHLLGLPDLYAYTSAAGEDAHRFAGGWDVMGLISGHANELMAWHKHRLGWLPATSIACVTAKGSTTHELRPLSSAIGLRALAVPVGGDRHRVHVLEYRDGTGRDAGSCATGVLAYRVDQVGVASGEGVVQVRDATTGSDPQEGPDPGSCEHDLDDAVLTPATGTLDLGDGVTARVESLGATARVTVTRSDGTRPVPTAHDPAEHCDGQQDGQGRFSDVPDDHAFAYTINCIVGHAITGGYPDGTFRPAGTLSRAQTARFLANTLEQAGRLPAWSGTDHFDDDDGTAHEEATNRLADVGVLSTATRTFDPGGATTRSTMAAWTVAALAHGGRTTADATDWYSDDEQDPNQAEINALSSLGVVTGKGGGRYDPTGTLTRAQMATFLARTYSVLLG